MVIAFYKEMKKNNLNADEEYGVKKFSTALEGIRYMT